MARSSSSTWVVRLDRVALGSLLGGLCLYVMPWWREGRLGAAFWLTIAAALLHTYTSHERAQGEGV